jgi:anti-sigma factor RsiW
MNGDSSHRTEPDERTERDLVLLADGRLEGRARSELEARVASSPALRAALERQRRAATTLRSLELRAPLPLRERIESERRAPSARVRRRRFAIAGALAAGAAAAALVAVLVLPSGTGGPTVVEAAQLAELPATEQRVPVDPANPAVLTEDVEGIPFPNLRPEFGWRAAGARSDELEGRETRTVFYERRGQRIGYTILAGDAIDPPEDATPSVLSDVDLNSLDDDGREIVTWLRGGLTCVLSGEGVSPAELRELAAWKGEGTVPF